MASGSDLVVAEQRLRIRLDGRLLVDDDALVLFELRPLDAAVAARVHHPDDLA